MFGGLKGGYLRLPSVLHPSRQNTKKTTSFQMFLTCRLLSEESDSSAVSPCFSAVLWHLSTQVCERSQKGVFFHNKNVSRQMFVRIAADCTQSSVAQKPTMKK